MLHEQVVLAFKSTTGLSPPHAKVGGTPPATRSLSTSPGHCGETWDGPTQKYVNIPSEKYFYVHIYVCICVYTYLCKMDEYRSYASLS